MFSQLFVLAIPFPKYTIGIALDFGVFIGHFEAFGCPQTVLFVNLYAEVAATEFLGHDSCRATAHKGVEDHIALA